MGLDISRVELSKEYKREEALYVKAEYEMFYECDEPDGSPKKEALRSALIKAKERFSNIWCAIHHAPHLF
jgi:hypothetical protein